jgi:hypothetical protein
MLRGIEKRFKNKGRAIERWLLIRTLLASLFFCISFTGYNPPNIELSFYFFANCMAYVMIFFALFSSSYMRRFCDWLGIYVRKLFKIRGIFWVLAAFIFVFSMSYHMSWTLFMHFPWIDDTIVQLVHAKFLLTGHWYGHSHPLPRFFDMTMMINNGKWYSQYPPGHVLMLAAGMALGHAEMVNPFLGACTCLAVWLLAKEVYGAHVARIAVFLTGICTYLIIFSSEYMSNATSLLTATLFFWAYFHVLHKPEKQVWFAIVAGLTLGFFFITRPYSALGLAIPSALYGLYLALRFPRRYFKPMLLVAALVSCFVLFQLYYNTVTTGDAFVFGYQKSHGNKHNPFTSEAIERYTNVEKYKYLSLNLQRLVYFNRILFEWPVPSLGLIAILWAIRGHRSDERLLMCSILSMFVSVQLIVHKDIGWGPRLVYEINGILLIFSAKALSQLPPLWRKLSNQRYPLRFYYGAGIVILTSFYTYSFQYNLKPDVIREFYVLDEREGDPEFYNAIVKNVETPALVFVPIGYYKYVSFTNPPTRTNPIIYAIDLGALNTMLIKMYRKRNVYIVVQKGTSLTIDKVK